ncbi:non-canonical purine NTP pyrophosphatase [Nibricoccus aquaticus]|uniref:dITP/XTP pyrophosphatase n=1 Tax=Nibricoccus aquaticus TaxID=2576891 RepID=A0A290Q919_9BACT|nr:non-canonical purine NTP pyrophosphatase [Nibricoccus aquaticus]ATC62736.1 non-canonical purine NTP pyrophosphatase [Nibricoccus aquaticus]
MKIYLASGNAHKVQEFQAIADRARAEGGVAVEFVSAKAVGGMPEVVEDTGTFVGNARKKAVALRAKLEASPVSKDTLWVLADDSGICVDALGGTPGVESAYFAGPEGNPAANLRKLVEVMRGVPDGKRGAHFVCVLVLLGPGGVEQVVEERVYGTLLVEPRGGAGFGYDPLFVPVGEKESLAELGEALKNQISHRARAAGRLMGWLGANGSV